MEFTRSGRLRASGRRWVRRGALFTAAGIGWAVLVKGEARDTALLLLALAAVSVLAGVADLRRAARPFSLRIDGYGITLREGGLDWSRIEGVALHYRAAYLLDDEGRDSSAPPPHLHVYPGAGAELPGLRTSEAGGRRVHEVVDTAELDQGLDQLLEALIRYAGPRFEGAPTGLRRAVAPGPLTLQGPGFGPPIDARGGPADPAPTGAARTFTARRNTGLHLLLALALATAGTAATVPLFTTGTAWGTELTSALGPLGAVLGWSLSLLCFRQWVRPLRLRIGPDGLTVQNFATPAVAIRWDQVVAVTVARRPGSLEEHLWLLLWPVPGQSFALPRELTGGHQTYPLVELRRLREEGEVESAARYFAGSRYAEPA